MARSWKLLWWIAVSLSEVICKTAGSDNRRPIWNVGHMVNTLYQVDFFLNDGANSVEFDIAFDAGGKARYTYHGVPCDCFRSCLRYENIDTYFDYLRKITTPGTPEYRENLVLLFMDLKIGGLTSAAKERAGEDIAMKLIEKYWMRGLSGANAYILVSLPSIYHMDFVSSFRNKLVSENFSHYYEKIGFDFSGNEDLDNIRYGFESVSIDKNIWQGDGITNCLPRGTSRLREALRRRDQPGLTYVDKVYWWTVDKMSTMRTVLRMNIDGMITNYPDRLVRVLKEDEFSSKFRLATKEDNPWIKHPLKSASLTSAQLQARGGNFTVDDFIDEEEELLYNCDDDQDTKKEYL